MNRRIRPTSTTDRVLALFDGFTHLRARQVACGLGITQEYASVVLGCLTRSGLLQRQPYTRALPGGCRYEYSRKVA